MSTQDRWGLNQPSELHSSVDWNRAAEDPAYRRRAEEAFKREYPRGRSDPAANPPRAFAHLVDSFGRPYQTNDHRYFPRGPKK